jgi:tripartite-type tricarboxylate transporter receptor subunit TctC
MTKIRASSALIGLWAMAMATSQTEAQTYPAKPMRVIVPGPAGGGLDVIARNVVQQLAAAGRAEFYIENLPGAGGSIGTGSAANAAADGYTILVTNQDFVIHPLIKPKVPYDPFKSFTPVTLVATAPEVLAVTPSLPAGTMKELITLLRASPGRYNYATPGFGTSPHLANERLFKLTHGVDVVHVPFQGAPPAVAATIAGDTQVIHITLPLIAPHIRSGKLKALAIAAARRAPEFPDLPTLAEAGVPGHEVGFWVGVMAPAGTPKSIVEWLQGQIRDLMSQTEARASLEKLGFEIIASTPEQMGDHIRAESERWSKVVQAASIRAN